MTLVPAFLGTENTEMVGINNVGDAIAQSRVVATQGSFLGFVRRNGVWSQIPVPAPYTCFRPFRINALGMVTGQVNVPPNPGTAAIFVNGETHRLDAPLTFAALLEQLGLAGRRVALERNGRIIPRSEHALAGVTDGDRIEIVVAVGGG